jgi:hypothetical protein
MIRHLHLLFVLLVPFGTMAQEINGDWILKRVDEIRGSENKISVAVMNIKGKRGDRSVKSKSYIHGMTRSYTEYLAPARDAGTKMLKLEDQLWTYSPATDRTILISGHLLRQSVMGSDLSYEDLMEDPRLSSLYSARITGEENILGSRCWMLQLDSRVPDITYYSRKVWVDQERFVILREDRYAKSGKLLKTTEVLTVEQIEARWIATRVRFKDVLKTGEGTEFAIESIEFNADIPEYIFTKAVLKK